MPLPEQRIIQQTKVWVKDVVIGLNLCPFASAPFLDDRIDYVLCTADPTEQHLQHLADYFTKLDTVTGIETGLLIYPESYRAFDDYLDFLYLADQLIEVLGYTGTYQIASFHPDYCFDGVSENDASNFTNRSPYPMLHLIRESSLEKAVAAYPDIEQVPVNNIRKLREIGYRKMCETLRKITG